MLICLSPVQDSTTMNHKRCQDKQTINPGRSCNAGLNDDKQIAVAKTMEFIYNLLMGGVTMSRCVSIHRDRRTTPLQILTTYLLRAFVDAQGAPPTPCRAG